MSIAIVILSVFLFAGTATAGTECVDFQRINDHLGQWINKCSVAIRVRWGGEGRNFCVKNNSNQKYPCGAPIGPHEKYMSVVPEHSVRWFACRNDGDREPIEKMNGDTGCFNRHDDIGILGILDFMIARVHYGKNLQEAQRNGLVELSNGGKGWNIISYQGGSESESMSDLAASVEGMFDDLSPDSDDNLESGDEQDTAAALAFLGGMAQGYLEHKGYRSGGSSIGSIARGQSGGGCTPLPPRCHRASNAGTARINRLRQSGISGAARNQYCAYKIGIRSNEICAQEYRSRQQWRCAKLSQKQADAYRSALPRLRTIYQRSSETGSVLSCY